MNNKVIILILNWNKKDFLLDLLKQIQNLEYKNFECLVVDNASTDTSVKEIKRQFPHVKIIVNSENLGGTGGYNSGIKYVSENINCKYIWLIDNDAQINSKTLTELVKVIEKNNDIGIAGSRIVDIENKEVTVELGSFIRWDTIGVKPFLRNKNIDNFDYEYIETDYVAICSAIIRCDSIKKTGLMDERFFIFWDDMDWGLQFKKAGLKVVAVPSSIVFHPSFTERKRGIATDYYYGIRNPLLFYSKNTKALLRLKIFYVFFRNYCMFLSLLLLDKKWNYLKFSVMAINDFVFNKWGNCRLDPMKIKKSNIEDISNIKLKNKRALVVFDNYNDIGTEILRTIKKNIQGVEVHALIDEDRKELYEKYFDKIIVINVDKRKTSLLYNFLVFIKILKLKFDFSVGSNSNPFGYATKKYFIFNNGKFEKTKIGISNLHKVIVSTILGELISLVITPIVFLSSFRYGKH